MHEPVAAIRTFGPFRFDTQTRLLTRNETRVRATPKCLGLLAALIESAGQIVSKDDLVRKVWPETFVDDGSLTFHIHQLRQALGDDASHPIYVETVPRCGYRFIAPISAPVADDSSSRNQTSSEGTGAMETPSTDAAAVRKAQRGRRRQAWAALLALAGTLAGGVATATRWREPPLPRVLKVTRLTRDGRSKQGTMPLDASRLLVLSNYSHLTARTDGSGVESTDPFATYWVRDVSSTRGEALAVRPLDPGAERGLWAVTLDGRHARRLGAAKTDGPAVWSHDGARIAYAYEHTVLVADAEGSRIETAATFTGSPAAIRWSKNDAILRVHVANAGDRVVGLETYDVASHGGETRLVIPAQPQFPYLSDGDWLPGSGDYILTCGDDRARQLCVLRERSSVFGRPRTELRRLEVPAVPRVDAFSCPVPSRDGTRLFVLGATPPHLTRFDAVRQEFVPFFDHLAAFAVEFSRDGRWLTYIAFPEMTLWRARPDGSGRRQLTYPPSVVDASAVSPDGAQIAIRMAAPAQRARIYLMPADGGTPVPIEPHDIAQGSPSWSPNGKQLVYGDVPEQYGQPTGSERIHVYDLETHTQTDLRFSRGLWSSRWSPDGTYIAATRIVDRRLFLFNVAEKRWRELDVADVAELTWSRDGRYLYLEPEPHARWLRRLRVGDFAVDQVTDLIGTSIAHLGAGVAADGSPLILRAENDVFAFELARR